ncbi:MAG: 50S ribosomal protein L6 [Candidatus Bathyarchaeota archaeon]|nr:50S ribosomal protein L6 [Candidatus Termiticorpusculum sp.]MCL1970963.1 50S ribosomal protein L6 [Candidatus Termiticorpusculum sp.]
MRLPEISRTIQVPEDVTLNLQGKKVSVKGEKGSLTRDFSFAPISIDADGKNVRVSAKWPRKKESALVGTIYSHIQNMITGVTKGYTYKLKIVFSHFPISVKLEGKNIIIENFTGERKARCTRILGDVKVKIETDDIIISGINLEDVSQTAANIEQATRVRNKDVRVFLDGLYVYERNEGMA